ncbi:hypothetical protein L484_017709 [Morus notabilis]|uniref:Uncharacterized protein n=1 Tax=Morus notabilis TaxID=981085 RepID=W9SC10_9ROSA|nr:hypothetical protein L484_017709 [Morus notabilis]
MSGLKDEDEERRRQRKLEEALEVKSLRRIISANLNYPDAADADVKRCERSFKKLPPAHKALLSHYPFKLQKLRRCISVNSYFIFSMLQAFEPPLDMSQDIDCCENSHLEDAPNDHGSSGAQDACACHPSSTSGRSCFSKSNQACCEEESNLCNSPRGVIANKEVENEEHCESITGCKNLGLEYDKETETCCGNDANYSNGNVCSSSHEWLDPSFQLDVPLVDVDKVRCVIRNIVRDWAEEGQKERDQCYKPVLEELDSLFPNRSEESPRACLVPGAGLGRLALEISRLGFVSQGNEFSYYMMICSSFILNHTEVAGEWKIHPWIHSNCNSLSDSDQLRAVSIPDIHPARKLCISVINNDPHSRIGSSAGITEGFSMCGGDFVEVYSDPSQVVFLHFPLISELPEALDVIAMTGIQ